MLRRRCTITVPPEVTCNSCTTFKFLVIVHCLKQPIFYVHCIKGVCSPNVLRLFYCHNTDRLFTLISMMSENDLYDCNFSVLSTCKPQLRNTKYWKDQPRKCYEKWIKFSVSATSAKSMLRLAALCGECRGQFVHMPGVTGNGRTQTVSLTNPQQKTSMGVRSGDLGGHCIGPPRPVHWPERSSSRNDLTSSWKCVSPRLLCESYFEYLNPAAVAWQTRFLSPAILQRIAARKMFFPTLLHRH
jgi:hypothetical protein